MNVGGWRFGAREFAKDAYADEQCCTRRNPTCGRSMFQIIAAATQYGVPPNAGSCQFLADRQNH
jgi:hypothetical protein